MFSMICAWINGWVNNREAGDLRRRRAHYEFIVMNFLMRHISLLMHISIYDICAKYGVLWSVMIWQTMAFDYMLHTSPSKCKTTCTSHFTFDAVAWRPVAWFICDAFEILWNAGYWMGSRHMYRVLFDNTCTMLRSNPYSPSELFSYCFVNVSDQCLIDWRVFVNSDDTLWFLDMRFRVWMDITSMNTGTIFINDMQSLPLLLIITVTSKRVQWRLKSPASALFIQPFIQAQMEENIKAPRHWPLCSEFPGDRWIPRTNGK